LVFGPIQELVQKRKLVQKNLGFGPKTLVFGKKRKGTERKEKHREESKGTDQFKKKILNIKNV
jgi:hypothetical protein